MEPVRTSRGRIVHQLDRGLDLSPFNGFCLFTDIQSNAKLIHFRVGKSLLAHLLNSVVEEG